MSNTNGLRLLALQFSTDINDWTRILGLALIEQSNCKHMSTFLADARVTECRAGLAQAQFQKRIVTFQIKELGK